MTPHDVIARALYAHDPSGQGQDASERWKQPQTRATFDGYADSVLAALEAAGLAVVPREPTKGMRLDAIWDVANGGPPSKVWRTMIETAERELAASDTGGA